MGKSTLIYVGQRWGSDALELFSFERLASDLRPSCPTFGVWPLIYKAPQSQFAQRTPNVYSSPQAMCSAASPAQLLQPRSFIFDYKSLHSTTAQPLQ